MPGARSGHTSSTGHGAVVDDEAGGMAQAVRTETRTITITSHNQEVYAVGGSADDLALDPSPTMNKLRILPSEPLCCGLQDLQGLLVRDHLEVASGPVGPKSPTEQAGGRALGDLVDVRGRDMRRARRPRRGE